MVRNMRPLGFSIQTGKITEFLTMSQWEAFPQARHQTHHIFCTWSILVNYTVCRGFFLSHHNHGICTYKIPSLLCPYMLHFTLWEWRLLLQNQTAKMPIKSSKKTSYVFGHAYEWTSENRKVKIISNALTWSQSHLGVLRGPGHSTVDTLWIATICKYPLQSSCYMMDKPPPSGHGNLHNKVW
jgi:hypothetical protein